MAEAFSFKLLRSRTIQNRFNIIVGLLLLILALSMVETIAAVKVMSGIRAYVGGEGLWSKAQKEAVNYLVSYSTSRNEADYREFTLYTGVQLGDRQARLELDKANPDYNLVRQGFIQGNNNPDDVDDLTFLYRNFRTSKLMRPAVSTWERGDIEVQNMIAIAGQMHSTVLQSVPSNSAATEKLAALAAQAAATDKRLTVLEDEFSSSLGQGSRRVARLLYSLTVFTSGLLGALTLIVAVRSARSLIRLDKQKTEFVSLASHQLRTPLTAMNWYAEALLSESAGPVTSLQRDYLEELSAGGKRMAALISDLLKLSSLDLGTYRPQIKVVSIADVLNTVIKDLHPEIIKKHTDVSLHVDPKVPDLATDEQLLAGTLQNLIANSVKYTRKGGKVAVLVQHQRRHILIHVRDNGIGIPQKQQGQVFSKLFRADNAQKVDANGTGLGLYIVRAMVRAMGGRIWFESTEHQGTDFYVRLPISNTGRAREDAS